MQSGSRSSRRCSEKRRRPGGWFCGLTTAAASVGDHFFGFMTVDRKLDAGQGGPAVICGNRKEQYKTGIAKAMPVLCACGGKGKLRRRWNICDRVLLFRPQRGDRVALGSAHRGDQTAQDGQQRGEQHQDHGCIQRQYRCHLTAAGYRPDQHIAGDQQQLAEDDAQYAGEQTMIKVSALNTSDTLRLDAPMARRMPISLRRSSTLI